MVLSVLTLVLESAKEYEKKQEPDNKTAKMIKSLESSTKSGLLQDF